MGLENLAARGPEDELLQGDIRAFTEADIVLSSGEFSTAEGGFAGKVYAKLIRDITGEDLYQEWIPPDRVKKMYGALAQCKPEEMDLKCYGSTCDESTIINLRKFFRVCVERNLGLVGWWQGAES